VWRMSDVVGIGGSVFVKPPAERREEKENKIA
jgi:hypothetical protein